ncbi:MAG: amidase [Paracoccaceae bacterium]
MTPQDYATLDGIGLADLIRRGDVSAAEVTEAAAHAIERINPAVNAVVEVYEDRLSGPAALPDGPLAGVPFLIKDVGLGHEAGRLVENGSRLCRGIRAQGDSFIMGMLRAGGLNTMGRTNAPEFSIAGTTENSLYGNTSTPWRQGFSSGGSSGGAAAAVASGMVPIAHGSDIGGSIRIPAAWCGTVGLKPGRGRVSFGPYVDEGGFGLAMNLAQTRTIRDTAAILDVLSVPQPGDPFVIPRPAQGYLAGLSDAPRRYRIGWSAAPQMDAPVDPEVAAAVERVANLLAGMGHQVEEAAPDFDHEAACLKMLDLWFFGFDRKLAALAEQTGRQVGPDTLDPVTLKLADYGATVTPEAFMATLAFMNGQRRRIGQFFAGYDIWLSPTCATLPAQHGVLSQARSDLSVQDWLLMGDRAVQFCFPYNIAGLPAISLPLAQAANGLPIGVQMGAGAAQEHILLDVAQQLEQAMPWAGRIPPHHASR